MYIYVVGTWYHSNSIVPWLVLATHAVPLNIGFLRPIFFKRQNKRRSTICHMGLSENGEYPKWAVKSNGFGYSCAQSISDKPYDPKKTSKNNTLR